jgi:hypothetical protein
VLSLLDHGYSVTIVDNLDNAFEEAYRRMQELAGGKAGKMKFVKVLSPGPRWLHHRAIRQNVLLLSACGATCCARRGALRWGASVFAQPGRTHLSMNDAPAARAGRHAEL